MEQPPPLLTGEEEAIVLFSAQNREGKPFHAFIKLSLQSLAEFYEKQAAGESLDLNKLGEVLETGWGHNPPPQVTAQIIKQHQGSLK